MKAKSLVLLLVLVLAAACPAAAGLGVSGDVISELEWDPDKLWSGKVTFDNIQFSLNDWANVTFTLDSKDYVDYLTKPFAPEDFNLFTLKHYQVAVNGALYEGGQPLKLEYGRVHVYLTPETFYKGYQHGLQVKGLDIGPFATRAYFGWDGHGLKPVLGGKVTGNLTDSLRLTAVGVQYANYKDTFPSVIAENGERREWVAGTGYADDVLHVVEASSIDSGDTYTYWVKVVVDAAGTVKAIYGSEINLGAIPDLEADDKVILGYGALGTWLQSNFDPDDESKDQMSIEEDPEPEVYEYKDPVEMERVAEIKLEQTLPMGSASLLYLLQSNFEKEDDEAGETVHNNALIAELDLDLGDASVFTSNNLDLAYWSVDKGYGPRWASSETKSWKWGYNEVAALKNQIGYKASLSSDVNGVDLTATYKTYTSDDNKTDVYSGSLAKNIAGFDTKLSISRAYKEAADDTREIKVTAGRTFTTEAIPNASLEADYTFDYDTTKPGAADAEDTFTNTLVLTANADVWIFKDVELTANLEAETDDAGTTSWTRKLGFTYEAPNGVTFEGGLNLDDETDRSIKASITFSI